MITLTELLGSNDQHWMDDPDRKCLPSSDKPLDIELHADAWFPHEARSRQARRLCAGCPVATSCLQYALDNIELEGIWGGSTHADRKNIRNKRQRKNGAAA